MTDNKVAASASQPFIKAASLNVTQESNDVVVRVGFLHLDDSVQARELLGKQGWLIQDGTELDAHNRFNVKAVIPNTNLVAVIDRVNAVCTTQRTPAQP